MNDKTTEKPSPFTVHGYDKLAAVLELAYNQSARGKGKERHANDKPFDKQPILAIAGMCGTGFLTGQVQKKVQEASGMASRGAVSAAQAELLGAIVYAAAAYIHLDSLPEAGGDGATSTSSSDPVVENMRLQDRLERAASAAHYTPGRKRVALLERFHREGLPVPVELSHACEGLDYGEASAADKAWADSL